MPLSAIFGVLPHYKSCLNISMAKRALYPRLPALLTLLRVSEDHYSVVQTPGVLPAFGHISKEANRSDEPQMIADPIRILIVEKQQFIADALLALLSLQPGMVVVGNVESMAELAPELNPDVVILDFRMNDRLAADAARALNQTRSEAKVIFMTEDESDNVLLAAIDAGASAVLYMSTAAAQVIDAVRTVAIGGTLIPPHTIATLLTNRRKTDGLRDSLTSRELEILRLMAEGISNREIAGKLGISYVTVRSHIRRSSCATTTATRTGQSPSAWACQSARWPHAAAT
jgi:DNA-binding NarL/FixJ family response regulator